MPRLQLAWLRLVSAPADKASGKLWDGARDAQDAFGDLDGHRPALLAVHDTVDDGIAHRAKLSARVDQPVLSDDPILQHTLQLPDSWWANLAGTLEKVAAIDTDRIAVRQQYTDRAIPQFVGMPAPAVTCWSTAPSDVHWANLTASPLQLLDWEGWGRAPEGFDAAVLYAYTIAPMGRRRPRPRHLPGEPAGPRPSGQDAGEWEIPRIPLQYERAVLAGAVVREDLRTTTTAVRGRAYAVVAHQQAAMPEQLLAPEPADLEHDDQQEPGRREAMDLKALRALRESRTDVEALDLTAEHLRHLQDAFTEAADRAYTTMNRYARRDDAETPHPVREDDQQAHRPQQPGPHRGREAGH
jgi:hypothetical protein